MKLLDTHQHLIYRDRLGYAWAEGIPPLASGDFTVETYNELAGGQVAGALFMEAAVDDADYQQEARLIASIAHDSASSILGLIASCRPETEAGFEAWLDECAGMGVVGFRRVLHVVDDEMSRASIFRENIRRIGSRGMSFDMCFLARQLPVALELASACPDMTLVLDHCGVPDIAGGAFETWAADIDALAALPHVSCKLSGLTAYAGPDQDRAEAIRPYVDHVLSAFGPARMVWGSDWPVVDLGSGLPGWLDMTRDILTGLSPDEAADISHRTAQRIYRVTLPD